MTVLCLAVIPDLFHAILSLAAPDRPRVWTNDSAIALIVRAAQVTLPLIWIVRCTDGSLTHVGWRGIEPVRGLVIAGALTGAAFALALLAERVPAAILPQVRRPWRPPHGAIPVALLVVGQLANALAEEAVARGYLMTRIGELTRDGVAAVVLSAALFASYHVCEGLRGGLYSFVFGVLFGVTFRLTRSIWPLVAAHAAYNVLAFYR